MKTACNGTDWEQEGRKPCYQLWEISALDIEKKNHTDYGGRTDTYYGFVYQECGCFTELDANKIPLSVRSHAKAYYKRGTEDA